MHMSLDANMQSVIIIIIIIIIINRRITAATEDTRETVFLFERLSIALQRGMPSLAWLLLMPLL